MTQRLVAVPDPECPEGQPLDMADLLNLAMTARHAGAPLPSMPTVQASVEGPGVWVVHLQAPPVKVVTKRKTKKRAQRNPMLNANDRDHWRAVSPIRGNWRVLGTLAMLALGDAAPALQRCRIDVEVHRPTVGHADAGNFYPTAKPVVDGMVDAGLLPDDNDMHLSGPFLVPGRVGPYGLTLRITDLGAPLLGRDLIHNLLTVGDSA